MPKKITGIRSLNVDPQRQSQWEVEIVGLSTGSSERLTFQAQSTAIPESSSDTFEINFKKKRSWYSGRESADNTATITFFDTEDLFAYNFFMDWYQNLVSSPATGSGVSKPEMVADVVIRTTDFADENYTSTTTLKGAQLTTVGEMSLDYSEGSQTTFDVTFQFEEKDFQVGNA